MDDLLVIGIDFGTTFSGAAWATAADFQAGKVQLIDRWPGSGRTEGKAPTEIFYEDDQIFWGYEVPQDADPVRWFKLLLLKDEDLPPEFKSSEYILLGRKMLRETQKTATDLISDFLSKIWTHVLSEITKARGDSVIDALRFHVVITLPALWKGYARQGMQEAAEKAGILDYRDAGETTLSFAPEPEAAALFTLCEPGRVINEGEIYVVCDAGGGTVDLISYEIQSVDPLAVSEAVEGTGGLCGGIFIDEAFERICKKRLGRGWDRLSKVGIRDIMKGEWEYAIKPQFKLSHSNKAYIVGIPAEAFPKASMQNDNSRQPIIKNGRIHFTESDLKEAFTGVVSQVEDLVDGQVDSARTRDLDVTGIILVGGFGSSPYLYEALNSKYGPHIRILQASGMSPRTAICQGAVFKGFLNNKTTSGGNSAEGLDSLPIMITSTISRASFGLGFSTTFDPDKHLEEDKAWSKKEAEWHATNQVHWYLTKGENVSQSSPVRARWYRTFQKDFDKTLSLRISQCMDENPPTRVTESVTTLCSIEWTPDVSFSDLEWITNKEGGKYKKLHYDVEFIPLGATAEFAIYIEGRKQGTKGSTVNIQYDS
ncbi:actin-like ATPase domain-containing protein [Rostrohypoxylon terebratum]|nr:actin-like ATPase domain-containing protein [Rostrohypoxylon terebratum]